MRVILTGGLGNQLFKLMAAKKCLDFSKSKKLTLDISWFDDGNQAVRPKHIHFQLQGLIDDEMYFVKSTKMPFLHQLLMRRVSHLNNHFLMNLRILKDNGEFTPLNFKPWLVIGDFENYKYLPKFSTVFGILSRLDSNSFWKRNLIARIKEEDPIIMHVRLGDYANYPEIYGFLDVGYYVKALQIMRDKGIRGPVWLTSDNPETAIKILSGNIEFEYVIETPNSLEPLQLLLAIAESRNIIIAHSTFSWWAAWISFHQNKDATVVMPSRFVSQEKETKRLQVPGWHVVKV
jgi:hypothetical protein